MIVSISPNERKESISLLEMVKLSQTVLAAPTDKMGLVLLGISPTERGEMVLSMNKEALTLTLTLTQIGGELVLSMNKEDKCKALTSISLKDRVNTLMAMKIEGRASSLASKPLTLTLTLTLIGRKSVLISFETP